MNTPFQPNAHSRAITPADSARYTRDMLGQLKAIADEQGQKVLAHLLSLASMEADALQKQP
ncbi:MAG TPA: hypothetical protein VL026_13960 [Rhizomicrobium sp.]|nr:hypothetical protein [Rhizomicrobium sp.]